MVQRIMLCLLFVLRLFEKKLKTTAVRRRFWGKNKTEQMHNRGTRGPEKKLADSKRCTTEECAG
jgi:hypothetical protein